MDHASPKLVGFVVTVCMVDGRGSDAIEHTEVSFL